MRALKKSVHRKEYSSVQGSPELRQLIANFHFDHNKLKVNAEDILLAPGSKILIYNIMLAFKKADILIPAPAWVSYAPQVKLIGHNLIKVPTSFKKRWRVTPQSLTKAIEKKKHKPTLLILNHPGNPDGLTYNRKELKSLAKVAKENDILVISDEIYGLLDHNMDHLSFANYYPEKTITTSGMSKWCGAGGWRLGVAMLSEGIDPMLKKTLIGIGSETYSCAPMPVQMAAMKAYGNYKKTKPYLEYQTDILRKLGHYCAGQLQKSNIRVHYPDGGFYLFPDFEEHRQLLKKRGITSSSELCSRLLEETGVALLPASAFGFKKDTLAARLAYVDFDEPGMGQGFDLKKDAPRVVKGIKKIRAWLKE